MEEQVVLVDHEDRELGVCGKLEAHQKGLLHRAFSIVIFNAAHQMLLQRRARGKYHSAGLWSNACCSHPRPQERLQDAAHRRLEEEFGFDCPLDPAFSFVYRAALGQGLFEHEFDHVFIGTYDGHIHSPNPEEIDSWRWVDMDALHEELLAHPERFTAWFQLLVPKLANIPIKKS